MIDAVKTIGTMVDRQGVVFLGSVDENGWPNIKAMLSPRIREGNRVFYFHTNTSSMRVEQFRREPKACLYVCDQQAFRGVMLTGRVEVLEDAGHKEMLWREGDTMYYPKGVTDPDYCVLRFTAERGRAYRDLSSEDIEVG